MQGSFSYRFGPACLHMIGAALVLYMPISVIFEVDLKWGFDWGPVPVPNIRTGGFEHHGTVTAVCEVLGTMGIIAAALWATDLGGKIGALLDGSTPMGTTGVGSLPSCKGQE